MLYISEFNLMAVDARGNSLSVPWAPSVADDAIEIGAVSVQSKQFNPSARFIELHATEPCCIAFGVDPEAVPELRRMEAGETRIYGVHPEHKLAVIAAED